MRPTLHIIANCTDRKRASVSENLRLRSVPPGTLEERASSWWRRLICHRGQLIPAVDLYAGGHWAAVRRLCFLAEREGLKQSLWVVSAGYGLVSANALVHPYSATFAGSHPDSVTNNVTEEKPRKKLLQNWWKALCNFTAPTINKSHSISNLFQTFDHDRFLFVMSPDYLTAMEQDLLTALPHLESRSEVIIVSSRYKSINPTLDKFLVPSDARLQARVGGARNALNARVASMILDNSREWGFSAESIRKQVETLIAHSPAQTKYDRSPMSDGAVKDFIRRALKRSPLSSYTSLLRELRSSGRACEQGRFKNLYREVSGGNN